MNDGGMSIVSDICRLQNVTHSWPKKSIPDPVTMSPAHWLIGGFIHAAIHQQPYTASCLVSAPVKSSGLRQKGI